MSLTRPVFKGFLAGAIGGAIGTAFLNGVQKSSIAGMRAMPNNFSRAHSFGDQQQQLAEIFDRAHVKTAEVAAAIVGMEIPASQHRRAAQITEYAFGALCGGVYGAIAENVPSATTGFGTVFGTILFMGASEVVLPAIRFVPPLKERSAAQHLGGLSGNIVYGAVTEAVRRLCRR